MAPDVGSTPAPEPIELPNGWWKAYVEKVPGGYLDLLAAEEDASRIVHFHPTFVPGLLQTEEYATAITPMTTLKSVTAADVATLVRVRMLRQRAALEDSRSKELVFLLDEVSLRRQVGSPETMRRQLDHLLEMAGHPAVTLIVIPLQAQPHPGLLGAFMLLQYRAGLDDVICFEWQLGNTVIRDQPDLVRRYRTLANELAQFDLDGARAKQLITSALGDSS